MIAKKVLVILAHKAEEMVTVISAVPMLPRRRSRNIKICPDTSLTEARGSVRSESVAVRRNSRSYSSGVTSMVVFRQGEKDEGRNHFWQ